VLLLLICPLISAWVPSVYKTTLTSPYHGRISGKLPILYAFQEQGDQSVTNCSPSVSYFSGKPLRLFQNILASIVLSTTLVLIPAFPVVASSDRVETSAISPPSSTQQTNVVDEVWTLVNKYYIDRTYGEQNWNQVHDKYILLANNAKNDEVRFKLATEMVASLNDKYSRMLNRDQYSAIQKYDLIGVGVTLMPDGNKNMIVGAPPIPESEAARVGLQVGDYVTAINGVSTTGRNAFDIIDQIAEDPNAKSLTMTIRPKGSDGTDPGNVVTMSRAFAEIRNPVQYKISETRSDGTKVGFVKIAEFNAIVKGSLEKALAELEAAGVNAYVLDIRQNTGGAFQSAVEISSLFTEDRIATYVVDNTNVKLPFRTAKGQLAIDKTDPIVILIDGRSASASEVLAGSLHDNCRAVLMGEKSFGKGLIQAVYGLKNGDGLVLTVARYVTPSGSDIQGVGITPDFGTRDAPYNGPLLNIGGLGQLSLGMDTSRIDFKSIQSQLENVCQIPKEIN
jgi:carboxyl-terminal processing protease